MEIRYYNIWCITNVIDHVGHYTIEMISEGDKKACLHNISVEQIKESIDVLQVQEPKQMIGGTVISEAIYEDIFDDTTKFRLIPKESEILWKPVAIKCQNEITELFSI